MKKIISIMLGIMLITNTSFGYTLTLKQGEFSITRDGVLKDTIVKLIANKSAGATFVTNAGTIEYDRISPTSGTLRMPEENVTITVTDEIYVNPPKLGPGMTPLNWNRHTKEWEDTTELMWEWDYNSVAHDESDGSIEGNGCGKWANARTEDGSIWVWIPRYSYKIESGYHASAVSWSSDEYNEETDTKGKILVKFSNETQDIITENIENASEGYIAHPAFTLGTTELTGIWVAKYEMSMEKNGIPTNPSSATDGNVYTSETVKMVSKPNVESWRYISVGKSFTNSYNYNRTLDSHLMRNSEWGAVAYLTNAIGRIPYINNSNGYITGTSGAEQDSSESSTRYDENSNSNTEFAWNTVKGVKASTTHNVYGIYDMSGGGRERVAAYWTGGDRAYLKDDVGTNKYSGALYSAANDSEMSKYVETYSIAYDSNKKGDAMYETSSKGTDDFSWDGDHSYAPDSGGPVVTRSYTFPGGSIAGIFYFSAHAGTSYESFGFRTTLSIQ